jgi:F-type H+-transporting ATPase subunit delta
MPEDVYDKYFAKVIFEAALKDGELNRWLSQLRVISDVTGDSAIKKLLLDPTISYADKTKMLTSRIGDIDPLALKMVLMLASKGNLETIEEITDEYQRLLDSYHGVEGAQLVEVTTAIPLDEKDKLELSQRLTDIVEKPIILKATVDPDIIGGIIIKVGDKIIDGSMRTKLGELKKELD